MIINFKLSLVYIEMNSELKIKSKITNVLNYLILLLNIKKIYKAFNYIL